MLVPGAAALPSDAAAAAAERVGFVEEDDHAAVPDGQLAQPPEERLHLQHPDAEEHIDEGARVDEDVGLSGLSGHRLGHQSLAGARRPPQQDPARHVTAVILDRLRVLQEEDVLLHAREDVVLAPHVGEPGAHVAGVVHVDAAPGEEPEDSDELSDAERDDRQPIQDDRQRVVDRSRRLEQSLHRRGVVDETEDDGHDRDHDEDLDDAGQPEPGVVTELVSNLVAAAEHAGRHPVVERPPLGQQVAQLAHYLQHEQQGQPAAGARVQLQLLARSVGEAECRVLRHLVPDDDEPQPGEQDAELEPVPQGQRPSRLPAYPEQSVVLLPFPARSPASLTRWL